MPSGPSDENRHSGPSTDKGGTQKDKDKDKDKTPAPPKRGPPSTFTNRTPTYLRAPLNQQFENDSVEDPENASMVDVTQMDPSNSRPATSAPVPAAATTVTQPPNPLASSSTVLRHPAPSAPAPTATPAVTQPPDPVPPSPTVDRPMDPPYWELRNPFDNSTASTVTRPVSSGTSFTYLLNPSTPASAVPRPSYPQGTTNALPPNAHPSAPTATRAPESTQTGFVRVDADPERLALNTSTSSSGSSRRKREPSGNATAPSGSGPPAQVRRVNPAVPPVDGHTSASDSGAPAGSSSNSASDGTTVGHVGVTPKTAARPTTSGKTPGLHPVQTKPTSPARRASSATRPRGKSNATKPNPHSKSSEVAQPAVTGQAPSGAGRTVPNSTSLPGTIPIQSTRPVATAYPGTLNVPCSQGLGTAQAGSISPSPASSNVSALPIAAPEQPVQRAPNATDQAIRESQLEPPIAIDPRRPAHTTRPPDNYTMRQSDSTNSDGFVVVAPSPVNATNVVPRLENDVFHAQNGSDAATSQAAGQARGPATATDTTVNPVATSTRRGPYWNTGPSTDHEEVRRVVSTTGNPPAQNGFRLPALPDPTRRVVSGPPDTPARAARVHRRNNQSLSVASAALSLRDTPARNSGQATPGATRNRSGTLSDLQFSPIVQHISNTPSRPVSRPVDQSPQAPLSDLLNGLDSPGAESLPPPSYGNAAAEFDFAGRAFMMEPARRPPERDPNLPDFVIRQTQQSYPPYQPPQVPESPQPQETEYPPETEHPQQPQNPPHARHIADPRRVVTATGTLTTFPETPSRGSFTAILLDGPTEDCTVAIATPSRLGEPIDFHDPDTEILVGPSSQAPPGPQSPLAPAYEDEPSPPSPPLREVGPDETAEWIRAPTSNMSAVRSTARLDAPVPFAPRDHTPTAIEPPSSRPSSGLDSDAQTLSRIATPTFENMRIETQISAPGPAQQLPLPPIAAMVSPRHLRSSVFEAAQPVTARARAVLPAPPPGSSLASEVVSHTWHQLERFTRAETDHWNVRENVVALISLLTMVIPGPNTRQIIHGHLTPMQTAIFDSIIDRFVMAVAHRERTNQPVPEFMRLALGALYGQATHILAHDGPTMGRLREWWSLFGPPLGYSS